MTAAQLCAARKGLGMSQKQLAEALGVSRVSVARWESGARELPAWLSQRAAVTVLRLQGALAS